MNVFDLIMLIAFCLLVVIFLLGRWLYARSMRIRSQLQMSRVFTSITHELLTPLTILSASVEMLRQAQPGGQQEYDLMDLNIQRSVRLLQQILETSKSQAGELKLLVSNGDVMKYIRETARSIEPLMNRKHLTFTVNCKPESMMGWIDTDKLDKIIFNLLSNAAKYTEENGFVALRVATNRNYDRITIQVTDTGVGIPKDRMSHLFTRIYDGDYRHGDTIGTELGLALTHDLVYLHGGSIKCNSTEGEGTTFAIDLPINKEAFAPSQIDEKHQIEIDLSKERIADLPYMEDFIRQTAATTDENASRVLIVEDNKELLMLMKQLLQHQYHILTAHNGTEALEIVRSSKLDMVVSDVMMPEMDGYELTSQIKHDPNYSHLPVILLTAKTQEEDKQQALITGADAYISKPFKIGDLQLRIDNIIANRQRIHGEQPVAETDSLSEADVNPLNREFLERATSCVYEHLSDSDYDREAFAADMGSSVSTVYNKLRALTGMSISSFIRDIRIKAACQLAKDNHDLRVSDIAYRVGYKDPKYFATSFKRITGMQPKEYFEKMRN